MARRRRGDAAPPRPPRDGGASDAARRKPRELYDAGAAPSTGSAIEAAARDTPFRGEFEQRSRGPGGEGQHGRFGSDESLREQFCRRIAEDPRLAGTVVDVAIDAQALTLSGDIAVPAARDWILEHARGLGIGEIHDTLRLVTRRPSDQP
jgi:hypothetical protein